MSFAQIAAVVFCMTVFHGAPASPHGPGAGQSPGPHRNEPEQAADAERRIEHHRRLRDIDRMRHDAETAELHGSVAWLRGLAATLGLVLVAALLWLAVEVRQRRMLATALRALGSDVPRSGNDLDTGDPHGSA